MWRTIIEVKNKEKGQQGIIVGPGYSAEKLGECIKAVGGKPVMIALNRALVLFPRFDYLFTDHPATMELLRPYLENTKEICLPFYSRTTCNLNSKIAIEYQNKLLFYAWVYQNESLFDAPEYVLNDLLLYISWGVAQTALHFAKHIGLSSVTMIGVDGGAIDGKIAASKIIEIFGQMDNPKKRIKCYANTKAKMMDIANLIKIPLKYYGDTN